MATSPMSKVIQHLRRAVPARDEADMTDGQLLACFIARRDEAAFAALVGRHGPMVWGVCRRVLASLHDAEDAFQASFFVLARKAASIASRELLANWLYGVAHRTALKARAAGARRRLRERQLTNLPEPEVARPGTGQDALPLLDQELSRLADKYRVPIVLCDLEGKTRREAARQLGIPEGTVAGRLARARGPLAKRLSRRGVTLSGTSVVAAVSQSAAPACVPAAVPSAATRAACGLASGQATAVIPSRAAALAEAVLRAMGLTKLKAAVVYLVALAVAAVAGGELVRQELGASQGPAGQVGATPSSASKRSETRAAQEAARTEKPKQAPVREAPCIDEVIPELRDSAALLSTNPISRVKQPTTFCTGFRFRYPYGPPGAAITYSVDKPENHYVWPPKVDASTPAGRKAIYQTLRDTHPGGHFTMDGNELLVFGGARVVPFRFKDERVRKAWLDLFTRVPRARFAEFVKRQHTAAKVTGGPVEGSYALPLGQSSFFAALTSDDRVVILWVRQAAEEFRYDVGHYLLEPAAPAP
jgi:RNA polymerase sigma factor (sigma-70 family)